MIEENALKQIPYGVSDFNDFSRENLYYVDKTRFIRVIEKKGKYIVFNRPRRFGKSLFLSIMEYYYDIHYKDQFDAIFRGTYIHENPTSEKNSYLVLKLNFSMVNPSSIDLETTFNDYIKDSLCYFLSIYADILDIDATKAEKEINSRQSAAAAMVTLIKYCQGKKHKIYVIIDEYDNFANTILSTSGEKAFRDITHGEGFFRAFFNVLKGGTSDVNAPISRLFMTGVSPITLDDVTSGFNIASNISLDSDIDQIMGFTHSEVETMIEYYRQTGKIHHSTSELIELMSYWYNHYRFSINSTAEVFNTVHVLYFLKAYLQDSNIPTELIDRNAQIDYNKLRHLIIIDKKGEQKLTHQPNSNFNKLKQIIETDTALTYIKSGFPIKLIGASENFFSLLYYFGLLTIKGVTPSKKAILTIPNEFTKRLYYDYIQSVINETHAFHINPDDFSILMDNMAFEGKWKEAIQYIAGRMESSLGIRDLIDREKALQVFWNVYFGLNTLYVVHSEKELNQGFADIVLVPMLTQFPDIAYSYLIEFKYIKPADFEKTGSDEKVQSLRIEAETQLKRYSNDEKFMKSMGKTTLKKLVLIFSGNRMVYHGECLP